MFTPAFTTSPAPTVTFITSTSSTANASSYSFAGASIGTAALDRVVVVYCAIGGSVSDPVPSSFTFDGVAAQFSQIGATSTSLGGALFGSLIPTGTTATIAFNAAGTPLRAGIIVWTITGLTSYAPYQKGNGSSADPFVINVTSVVPAGGVAIAGCGSATNSSFVTTGMTEDADFAVEAALTMVGGHTSKSITTDLNGTVSFDTAATGRGSWMTFR